MHSVNYNPDKFNFIMFQIELNFIQDTLPKSITVYIIHVYGIVVLLPDALCTYTVYIYYVLSTDH